MAFQSVWYYTDLPEDIVDIIERDVSETFDEQMGDSKLHGDALNKEKRNSQNAWIPTTHWVGGFLWHYIQRGQTVRTSCMICGVLMENQCNTPDMVKDSSMDGIMMLDLQHNTNPQSVGNRQEGLGQ